MATVNLTTSPTELDDGTAAYITIVNSGSVDAILSRAGATQPLVVRLRPGQNTVLYPEGAAVTGVASSGTGTLSVLTTAPEVSGGEGGGGSSGGSGLLDFGLSSARPSASAVPRGTVYVSTDIAGGKAQFSTGSAWSNLAAPYAHHTQHLPWASDPMPLNDYWGLPYLTVPQQTTIDSAVAPDTPYLNDDPDFDCAPAINAAIATAASLGIPRVVLPKGAWYIRSTIYLGWLPAATPTLWSTANTPDAPTSGGPVPPVATPRGSIALEGGGWYGTKLVRHKDFDGILLDASGKDRDFGSFAKRLSIHRLNLDGGLTLGNESLHPVLRMYYGTVYEMSQVNILNAAGSGWRIVSVWDSEFQHIRVDNCGGNPGATYGGVTFTPNDTPTYPALHILSSDPGTTAGEYGYQTDSANNLKFYDMTVESYRDGAVWVDGTNGFVTGVNGLEFLNLKADTTTRNGPEIVITAGVGGNVNQQRSNQFISFDGVVLVPGAKVTGGAATGPWPAMKVQDTSALRIANALIAPQALTMDYGVQFNGNNTGVHIDGLSGTGGGYSGLVNFAAGQNDVNVSSAGMLNVGGNIPIYVGTPTYGDLSRPHVGSYGGSATNESNNGNILGGRTLIVPAGNAGSSIMQIGDTYPRSRRAADGSIRFSAGSTAEDTTLSRSAAGVVNSSGALAVSGLTGAAASRRVVGGTASAAPTSGTFAVGDVAVAANGNLWICTVAGTPGTWVGHSPNL